MTAADTLRRHLAGMGVPYDVLGSMTMVHADGITWAASDLYDGTLRLKVMQPLSPAEVVRIATKTQTGPHATMTSTCDEDGVGNSKCDACGGSISKGYKYCPWCGARFLGKDKE
jgi:hypothetical protein